MIVENLSRAEDGDPLSADGRAIGRVGLAVVSSATDDRHPRRPPGGERVAQSGRPEVHAVVVRDGYDVDAARAERVEGALRSTKRVRLGEQLCRGW